MESECATNEDDSTSEDEEEAAATPAVGQKPLVAGLNETGMLRLDGLNASTMPFAYSSPRRITHCVDVRPQLGLKRAALRAHVSQSSPAVGGDRALVRCLGLPRPVFGWLFGHEWFIGPRGHG